MSKFVSGITVVALLLASIAITSPAQAVALRVHREYGQGPVTIPAGVDRVEIVFHGRKGDPVGVDERCRKVSLRGRSGTVSRWIGGTWRLPAVGRYSFVLTGCESKRKRAAQLKKIRLRPLAVDGDARTLKWRFGAPYEDWAKVVVPHRGRVQVRSTSGAVSPWGTLYMEGEPLLDIANWHQEYELSPKAVYLEAGSPLANELGEMSPTADPLVPRAGERVVLIPAARRVVARATKAHPVSATLDGAAVSVAAERRYQEVGARFTSAGDQWVTAAVQGPLARRSLTQLALTGPDGSTLVGLNHATVGRFPDLWYLPEAGSYRLTVRTDPHHQSGTVGLASVRELDADMPADGQPLAFTAQEPGEWVVATGQLDHPPYQLSAEAAAGTEWQAFASILPLPLCRGAFCADYTSAFLSPDSPTNYFPLGVEGRYLFLVAFGAGQTGTVSLRLAPPA